MRIDDIKFYECSLCVYIWLVDTICCLWFYFYSTAVAILHVLLHFWLHLTEILWTWRWRHHNNIGQVELLDDMFCLFKMAKGIMKSQ